MPYMEVVGSVLGDDDDDDDIVVGHNYGGRLVVTGDDDDDDDDIVVGGRKKRRRRRAKRRLVQVQKADWRNGQLAPGVQAPDQGMMTLPMNGIGGTNTFTVAINQITFQGQLQKPFRGERLLVATVRTGATAVGRLLSLLFVGTDLQQADITGFDAELIGNVQGFGIRLTLSPAQPGVLIRMQTTLSTVLAGADTIQATVQLIGRIVH